MYYLQIVRTQYRIPDAITYLDFAILQYYSLQHYCHRLQFWPFYNPISRDRATELGQFCAGCFGRFLAHLGVKKSILVQFWTIFFIFLASFCRALWYERIKQLTNICLTTLSFIIYPFQGQKNPPPPIGLLCSSINRN